MESVLSGNGISDFVFNNQGHYESRDYCVQYRESHFSFISRLLEEEGIHYYYEHKDQNHQLILTDAPRANDPKPLRASYQVQGSSPDDTVNAEELKTLFGPVLWYLVEENLKSGCRLTLKNNELLNEKVMLG